MMEELDHELGIRVARQRFEPWLLKRMMEEVRSNTVAVDACEVFLDTNSSERRVGRAAVGESDRRGREPRACEQCVEDVLVEDEERAVEVDLGCADVRLARIHPSNAFDELCEEGDAGVAGQRESSVDVGSGLERPPSRMLFPLPPCALRETGATDVLDRDDRSAAGNVDDLVEGPYAQHVGVDEEHHVVGTFHRSERLRKCVVCAAVRRRGDDRQVRETLDSAGVGQVSTTTMATMAVDSERAHEGNEARVETFVRDGVDRDAQVHLRGRFMRTQRGVTGSVEFTAHTVAGRRVDYDGRAVRPSPSPVASLPPRRCLHRQSNRRGAVPG